MPSKLHQLHFRKFSKRGSLSSVLMDDGNGDEDVLTIFWNELGESPENDSEADNLLATLKGRLIALAKNPQDATVEKGVLRDPNDRKEWQQNVVWKLKQKAGWE